MTSSLGQPRGKADSRPIFDLYTATFSLPKGLTWNSTGLDVYVLEATQLVKGVEALLRCIKDAVGQSQAILLQWQRDTMFFERKEGRVYSFDELGAYMRDLIHMRHKAVTGGH